jgi:hypothetical protein
MLTGVDHNLSQFNPGLPFHVYPLILSYVLFKLASPPPLRSVFCIRTVYLTHLVT